MFAAIAALSATTILATPTPQPGWFLCDAVDAPVAALVGQRDPAGQVRITLVPRGTGLTSSAIYRIGDAEAGMNQLHYPLSRNGKPAGNLHYVQPAVLGDPSAAWTPTFSSVTIAGRTLGCRWVSHTLFLGLDARRSFLVTQEPGGLVYRSFDAARRGPAVTPPGFGRTNVATLTINGGVRDRVGAATRFRFANRGYGYEIMAPDGGVAHVTVRKGSRLVQTETLLGYTRHDP
jgi:hypothetical protein